MYMYVYMYMYAEVTYTYIRYIRMLIDRSSAGFNSCQQTNYWKR